MFVLSQCVGIYYGQVISKTEFRCHLCFSRDIQAYQVNQMRDRNSPDWRIWVSLATVDITKSQENKTYHILI